nr:unnamed protein product [Callosobruchus chinensis]
MAGMLTKVKKPAQASSAAPKKKKKKKETIDYSSVQADIDGKKGLITGESKSTPVGLTDKTRRSPHKRPTIRPRTDKSKSHSVGNIPSEKEKVRLQVVYKPPFKFSSPRTGVLVRTVVDKDAKKEETADLVDAVARQPRPKDEIDSNIHTVQLDLEVLLSESEFVFSD